MGIFGDDNETPWYDELEENVADDVRRILEERVSGDPAPDEQPEEETIEAIAEAQESGDVEDEGEEFEDLDAVEVIESQYLAPDNQASDEWELAHHFSFYEDALNYCAGVPVGVLYIVVNEDGSADVYRDEDYEGEAAA